MKSLKKRNSLFSKIKSVLNLSVFPQTFEVLRAGTHRTLFCVYLVFIQRFLACFFTYILTSQHWVEQKYLSYYHSSVKSLRPGECIRTASRRMIKQCQGDSHLGTRTEASITWQRVCVGLRRGLLHVLCGAQVCIQSMPYFETASQHRQSWVWRKWWILAEFEQWDLTEHVRKKKDRKHGEDRQNTTVQTKSELKKKRNSSYNEYPPNINSRPEWEHWNHESLQIGPQ